MLPDMTVPLCSAVPVVVGFPLSAAAVISESEWV